MLFCSRQYLVFFVAVFAVYWAMPVSRGPWLRRARIWLLLGASVYFYASWNKWLAAVVCLSSTADFLLARGMDHFQHRRWRQTMLGMSLTMNLALLAWFKYANFFLRSLEDALHAAGATASLPVLKIIVPIGISFYTFEAISYTVDVYLGRIRAEKSFSHFLLFILFFPHLIAGPIVRARDFLPQIGRDKRWDWARLNVGVQYFLLGLIKKLVIADRMALFADPLFADPTHYNTAAHWSGVLAYALQVYCDFSGYSDMAIGSAHMLGYKLAKNFDLPYLAPNLAEFWRRWHISLSSWLRDYVFLPLGGSRAGGWRTYRNLFVSFTVCGLWHGAAWPYVVFGMLQGLLVSGHRLWQEFSKKRPALERLLLSPPGTHLRKATTFTTFCLTLVIFRSPTLTSGFDMLGHMFWRHPGGGHALPLVALWLPALAMYLAHLAAEHNTWRRPLLSLPSPLRGLAYALTLSLALLFNPGAATAFIYFQF
ncbi:MAG TPA: MBOAT family O-acyltransferase [Pirellulales bacterium]|nr:MBOAT family O-acyltransferase [Pirellulales bacterium]